MSICATTVASVSFGSSGSSPPPPIWPRRTDLARKEGLPAYCVVADRTLAEPAAREALHLAGTTTPA